MTSIRHRLTRNLVLTLALLLGAGLAAIHYAVREALLNAFDTSLRAQAIAVTALTVQEDGDLEFNFPGDFLHDFDGAHSYFEVWDAGGNRLKRSSSLRDADLPLSAKGTPEHPKYWDLALPNGHAGRALGFTFTPKAVGRARDKKNPETLALVVATNREELDETLRGLLAAVAGGGALLLGAVFLAVPRVLGRGLAPLDRLAGQVAQIDADSLAARVPAAGLPAELQPICERLNALLARLEESFARERRFSADLAHELRTPLAELRSAAECALKWPETRDATTDRETLAVARQMEALVTQMLALARGERGSLAARCEPVAVDALARDVWRAFAARAEARGLSADFALAPATAPADPALLRSILANLFGNAVDYTPPDGAITVAVEAGPAGVTVRVANPADQLDPADVGKLFDRFWRKEAARSGSGQHVGLGLPLARTFATAMGWTLTAALDAERRLVFTLLGSATKE